MSEETNAGLNRAKPYQLMLFPLNNGATNVYFVLVLSYVLNFGSGVLMRGYALTGEKMKTIQAVNAARKEAVARGMSLEQAMRTITDETVKTG